MKTSRFATVILQKDKKRSCKLKENQYFIKIHH